MITTVEELFHELADLSAEGRARYLAEHNIAAPARKEVEALLAFDLSTGSVFQNDIGKLAAMAMPGPGFEMKGVRCGAYRLGDLVGRGGMGAVYFAERVDGEVNQRVAVKLLRPGADDPALRQRFLSERQILATLAHPNIARLLDAGHCENGQPYLVMEYVEGKTIDVYSGGLSIRHKIALFVKVCAAVGYLHRNLVVHRDLKPGNILVTEEGEPKLLDFGIARMLDFTGDSTTTAMRILTPDYASPEQVTGGAVTTATDIYSLGAMLYKLLTGASPHQFENYSMEGIAEAILRGKVLPPGKLAAGLRGDLEAILMKALRVEPRERYATIEQLSEDLENYLQSRPVRARQGDAWYRTRKLARRYWLPLTAATLAMAGLVGGVLVANHQRAIAERRFVQVRQLANKLIEIDTEVRKTPGTTRARELIVSTSLDYLGRLAAEVHGDPELELELGTGYMNISRLQGVPTVANLGHTDQAIASSRTAEKFITSVLAAQPDNRLALLRMAQIASDRMNIALRRGDDREALSFSNETVKWLQKYDTGGPVDRTTAEVLAVTYINVCNQLATVSHVDEAIRLCHRGSELAAMTGNSYRTGTAMLSLASALRVGGRLEEALQASREALPKMEQRPNLPDAVRNRTLAGALIRQGAILGERDTLSLGRSEEAVPILDRAWSIADDLAGRDLNDADSRDRLFIAAIIMTGILRDHDPRRSLAVCDHTLSRLAELSHSETALHQEVRMLAESSYALRSLGRNQEARERLNRAVERLRQLKLYPVTHIEPESSDTLSALADYDAATGNVPRAAETWENLLQLSLAADKPDTVLVDAAEVSRLYTKLAGLHGRLGHADLAARYRTRRLELWSRWDSRLPQNSFIHRQLSAATAPGPLS
jgi:tetratricopeptide (TPR) repeat protein/tRNA A-37 threonylcarbamoyl transferase component Bud32